MYRYVCSNGWSFEYLDVAIDCCILRVFFGCSGSVGETASAASAAGAASTLRALGGGVLVAAPTYTEQYGRQ